MPIIGLQKRARDLGRIRLGQKGDRGQPQKLDRFRFTSNSQALLEKVAALYGGHVQAWEDGTQSFELISNSTRIPIMVPPEPVQQWHKVYRRSGLAHKCDGQRNFITGELCDPDDPLHQEALEKPTTYLNVVLRDVEGIGVWLLTTHGWYAATELPDVAQFLAHAGGYVNGWLALDPREDHGVKDGKPYTHRYVVPIIEVDVTPAQLMAGEGSISAPTLEGPVQAPALQAPAAPQVPDYLAQAQDCSSADAVRSIWHKAKAAGHMTDELSEQLRIVADRLAPPAAEPASAPQPDAEGIVDAEIVDEQGDEAALAEADMVWQQILRATGAQGRTLAQTKEAFAVHAGGLDPDTASASELQGFLDTLTTGEQVSA